MKKNSPKNKKSKKPKTRSQRRSSNTKRRKAERYMKNSVYMWPVLVELFPDKEQKRLINDYLGCSRKLWNQMTDARNEWLDIRGEFMSAQLVTALFNALKYRFPYLRDVNQKVLQQVRMNNDKAYSDFAKGEKGRPDFKSKTDYNDSCRFPVDAVRGVDKDGRLNLTTRLKGLETGCSRKDLRMLKRFTKHIRSVTLRRDSRNRYFASILIKLPFWPKSLGEKINRNKSSEFRSAGHDLGIKSFASNDDGTFEEKISYPRLDKKLKLKQRKHSRHLERAKKIWKKNNPDKPMKEFKQSIRLEKSRIVTAKVHYHIAQKRKRYHHEVANEWLINNDLNCLETLKIKNMMKNHNLAKAISTQAWYSFQLILEYKSNRYGKFISRVPTNFPSSKNCSCCGYKMASMTLNVREWACPQCGTRHDRDTNAAINIRNEGLRLFLGSDARPASSRPETHGEAPTMDDRLLTSVKTGVSDLKSSAPMNREGRTARSPKAFGAKPLRKHVKR